MDPRKKPKFTTREILPLLAALSAALLAVWVALRFHGSRVSSEMLIVFVISVAVVAAYAAWNTALRRQVAQQTRDLQKQLSERRQAEAALHKSYEERANLERIVNRSPVVLIIWRGTPHRRSVDFVSSNIDRFGYSPQDLRQGGRQFVDLIEPEDRDRVIDEFMARVASRETEFALDYRIVCKNAEVRAVHDRTWIEGSGDSQCYHSMIEDITEEKQIRDQLRMAEKMEAIGQLAGGVAHDFNNQLAGILGNAELLKVSTDKGDERYEFVNQIIKATKRSRDLTAQLLAFARKGNYQSAPVDMHGLIAEVISLLQHSLKKDIRIAYRLDAESSVVVGDPSQLENALLNMGVNARDAMPKGGTLTFATRLENLDEEACRRFPFRMDAGKYVRIDVSDTGVGMDDLTCKRCFEPFFTTKEPGRGTGMGLAAVYGTVKNHRGAVTVQSAPGQGATFTVYLPLAGELAPDEAERSADSAARPGAHILVIDDEEPTRTVVARLLESMGYRVSACPDGQSAVAFYRDSWKSVHLIVLDMIMPGMSGRETFAALRQINPDARFILSSGYSASEETHAIMDDKVAAFVLKPYTMEEMQKVLTGALSKRTS